MGTSACVSTCSVLFFELGKWRSATYFPIAASASGLHLRSFFAGAGAGVAGLPGSGLVPSGLSWATAEAASRRTIDAARTLIGGTSRTVVSRLLGGRRLGRSGSRRRGHRRGGLLLGLRGGLRRLALRRVEELPVHRVVGELDEPVALHRRERRLLREVGAVRAFVVGELRLGLLARDRQ